MFVDASAIVAILTREPGARMLADRLQDAETPITSPVAIYEAVLAINRKRPSRLDEVRAEVDAFVTETGIKVVPVTRDDADRALIAHGHYGKGTGHPARLNMGDCFAYAVARRHGASLLFKGEDFTLTDLGAA